MSKTITKTELLDKLDNFSLEELLEIIEAAFQAIRKKLQNSKEVS